MEKSAYLHQFDYGLRERTVEELAATLRLGRIDCIKVKTHDGSTLLGAFDASPLSFHSVADVAERYQEFAAEGVTLVPWTNPTGRDVDAEVELAIHVARVCGQHIEIDLEPYEGFWLVNRERIPEYFQRLAEAGLTVDCDAHVSGYTTQVLPFPDLVPLVRRFLGQTYWTTFKRPAPEVVRYEAAYWRSINAQEFGFIFPARDEGSQLGPRQYLAAYRAVVEVGGLEIGIWSMNQATLATYETLLAIPGRPPAPDLDREPPARSRQATRDEIWRVLGLLEARYPDTQPETDLIRRMVTELQRTEDFRVRLRQPRPG